MSRAPTQMFVCHSGPFTNTRAGDDQTSSSQPGRYRTNLERGSFARALAYAFCRISRLAHHARSVARGCLADLVDDSTTDAAPTTADREHDRRLLAARDDDSPHGRRAPRARSFGLGCSYRGRLPEHLLLASTSA